MLRPPWRALSWAVAAVPSLREYRALLLHAFCVAASYEPAEVKAVQPCHVYVYGNASASAKAVVFCQHWLNHSMSRVNTHFPATHSCQGRGFMPIW